MGVVNRGMCPVADLSHRNPQNFLPNIVAAPPLSTEHIISSAYEKFMQRTGPPGLYIIVVRIAIH